MSTGYGTSGGVSVYSMMLFHPTDTLLSLEFSFCDVFAAAEVLCFPRNIPYVYLLMTISPCQGLLSRLSVTAGQRFVMHMQISMRLGRQNNDQLLFYTPSLIRICLIAEKCLLPIWMSMSFHRGDLWTVLAISLSSAAGAISSTDGASTFLSSITKVELVELIIRRMSFISELRYLCMISWLNIHMFLDKLPTGYGSLLFNPSLTSM